LYKKLTYDPAKFTYIGGLARFPLVLAVPADSPYQTLAELVETAKKEPGKLSASSAGAGSPHHLALERFKQITGTDILHVPYRGAAPALQDLIGKRVDLMFADLGSGLSNIKAGKVRVLAVAVPERLSAVLPDAPTMNESGVPDFVAYAWQGLVGPQNLPEEVVSKVSNDLQKVLANEELKQKIHGMGIEVMPMSAEDFKAYSDKERADWAKVIEAGNITLD
ncbi:MAG: tripartite tricarboxylate transporter substrate binding protein, partial [Alcaligenaceae bacterium]|nr:tripartite tricarboxylate transporter substrate binding protein [Alcaligenaceae bacterium]